MIGAAIKTAQVITEMVVGTPEEQEARKKASEEERKRVDEQQRAAAEKQNKELQEAQLKTDQANSQRALRDTKYLEDAISSLPDQLKNSADIVQRVRAMTKASGNSVDVQQFLKSFEGREQESRARIEGLGIKELNDPKTVAESVKLIPGQGAEKIEQFRQIVKPVQNTLYFTINSLEALQASFNEIKLDKGHFPKELLEMREEVRKSLRDLKMAQTRVGEIDGLYLKPAERSQTVN